MSEELVSPRVLVAHASRHGGTAGIALRIASRLHERGLDAHSVEVTGVKDVGSYDAFVVGGAVYMSHWMKEATSFVKSHRKLLAARPLWLFSSGPLGTDLVDAEGRDVLMTSRPGEFADLEGLRPRGMQVFFGAYDPGSPAVEVTERMLRRMSGSEGLLPVGDFRDWDAIDAWGDEIAAGLGVEAPVHVR